MLQKVQVINQTIDNISREALLGKIQSAIKNKQVLKIATVNPEFIVASVRNAKFAKSLSNFDIKLADGFGIVFMSALFGQGSVIRTTGVDLTYDLIKSANANKVKITMLGASEESAHQACNKLRSNYPSLKVDCISGGVINPDDIDATLIENLRTSKPDILFVGLGSPKQEYFIEKVQQLLPPCVTMGVGGTIDFISGTAHRAPKFLRSVGLEWLWRLVTQPKRFNRIINAVIVFPAYYLRWKISGSNR